MLPETGPRQLTSWKDIAEYLSVSVRTAQTWEHERGLPVQRMPGDKGRVLATAQDLDRWRQLSLRANGWWSHPAHLRALALSFAVLFAGLCGYEIAAHLRQYVGRQAASYRLGRRSVTVLDSRGKDLWRVPFAQPFESADYTDAQLAAHRKVSFDDIDGDGDVETLFVYSPLDSLRNPSALYCFSRNGKERWNFAPERMSGASQGYGQIHVLNDLLVTRPNGKSEAYTLLLDCRLPGHSAKLFVLSPRGETLATFTHEGHLGMLEAVDVDGCGRKEVLVGGAARERNEAELIVLEMPHDFGGSAAQAGLAREVHPPQIREKAVLIFPRTCVNRKLEESNRIAHIAHSGDVLTVVVSELSDDPSVEVTYQLDRQFRVQAAWFSDALKNLHRNLTAQGILHHSLSEEEVRELRNITRLPPNHNHNGEAGFLAADELRP